MKWNQRVQFCKNYYSFFYSANTILPFSTGSWMISGISSSSSESSWEASSESCSASSSESESSGGGARNPFAISWKKNWGLARDPGHSLGKLRQGGWQGGLAPQVVRAPEDGLLRRLLVVRVFQPSWKRRYFLFLFWLDNGGQPVFCEAARWLSLGKCIGQDLFLAPDIRNLEGFVLGAVFLLRHSKLCKFYTSFYLTTCWAF